MARAQVSIFIIIGIVIMIAVSLLFMFRSQNLETAGKAIETETFFELENYMDTCLHDSTINALWQIGVNGGYSTENLAAVEHINISNVIAAVYYTGNTPTLEDITTNLAAELSLEIKDCTNLDSFPFTVQEQASPSFNIAFNDKDVSVKMSYPLTAKKGTASRNFDEFYTRIPLSFETIYDNAIQLTEKAAAGYNISDDCDIYDFNGLTNTYNKDGLIEFHDFSTHYLFNKTLTKTFIYRFYVGNSVKGACTG